MTQTTPSAARSSDLPYPVRVRAVLDTPLSRWLWLVKWLLIVPHVLVLFVLWAAFALLGIVALVAIVVTGRYPRPIFDFNLGVMRWSWRVGYYAYGVLSTDRYPPFSLAEEPDYPATLDIEYPERLSRGLALVKWWLLAIPHYLVLAILIGGVTWFAWGLGDSSWAWGGSLVGLLVLIAAIVQMFTGSYPRALFDIILGIHRWSLRVAGYTGLMTDRYPPFRFDLGGDEPSAPTATDTVETPVPVRHAD
jgi:hypothetical protein